MDNPFIIFPYRDNILELQTKHENKVLFINLKMCKGGTYTQIINNIKHKHHFSLQVRNIVCF